MGWMRIGGYSGSMGARSPNRFRYLCRKLKIKNLGLHDLRHEAISRFVECEKFLAPEVMKISGHASWKHFQRYLNPRGEELAARLVA